MRIKQMAFGILLASFVVQPSLASDQGGIQMMPPFGFDNLTVCGQTNDKTGYVAGAGMLYWDGSSAIKCIPGAVGDQNGRLQANWFQATGTAQSEAAEASTIVLDEDSAGTAHPAGRLGLYGPNSSTRGSFLRTCS